MAKEKYNIVITSSKENTIKIGALEINFDGSKMYGIKNIPLEELTKLRDQLNKKGMYFTYVDTFYGCFETFDYKSGKTASDLLKDKMSRRGKQSKKVEPVVEEPKVEEPVEPVVAEETVEEVQEPVVEEPSVSVAIEETVITPTEEVINEQPSESE